MGRDPKYNLTLLLALFSVLCTFHSDTIEQHDYRIPDLVYKSLKYAISPQSLTLSTLADPGAENGRCIYVFALDTGRSMSAIKDVVPPSWYAESVHSINAQLSGKDRLEELNWRVSLSDLAVVQLYRMLQDISNDNAEFAVWVFGEHARFLLESRLAPTGAIEAVEAVLQTRDPDMTTNFYKLFGALAARYERYPDESTSIILTIFSDFNDSADPWLFRGRSVTASETLHRLEMQIRELDLKMSVNLVDSSRIAANPLGDNVLPTMTRQIQSSLIRVLDPSGDIDSASFLAPVALKRQIPFYYIYDKPFGVDTLPLMLNFDRKEDIRIGAVSSDSNQREYPFGIRWEVLGRGPSSEYMIKKFGDLELGKSSPKIEIDAEDRVRFTYYGPLSPGLLQVSLEILVPEKKISYLIPLRFIKLLPPWSSAAFLAVFLLSLLTAIASLVLFWIDFIKGVKAVR